MRLEAACGAGQGRGAGIGTSPSQDCSHEWGCGVEGGQTSGESLPGKDQFGPNLPCQMLPTACPRRDSSLGQLFQRAGSSLEHLEA